MAKLPLAFGRYVLLKALSTSATSEVFIARAEPSSGVPSPLVIKRLRAELALQDGFYRRFEHEAELGRSLRSTHLPEVYEVGRIDDTLYIAMEYLSGWTLDRLIADLKASGQRPSLSSVVDIVSGALEALHVLHTAQDRGTGDLLGIVHRDIAPKNIMLGEDGISRLIDFGLGRSRLKEWKTATGVVLGTPGYMAPEQVAAGPLDHRTDIYAMGIVLFELITLTSFIKRGSVPLMLRAQASPVFRLPSALTAGVPAALDEICAKALAIDPDQRFPSARAFLSALGTAIPHVETSDRPLPTLVGRMLWGELEQSKSELTQLVAEPDGVELEATRTNRRPTLISEPIVVERVSPPRISELARDPAASIDAFATPPASMPGTPMMFAVEPPRRGMPAYVVFALMGMTLVLGLGLGAFLQRPRAPAPLPSPVEEPIAPAAPKAALRMPEAPSAVPAQREPEPGLLEAREPREPREARPSRSASRATPARRVEAARRSPAPEPPSEGEERPTLERANALIRRARLAEARLPSDSRPRAANLISRLSMEASSLDADGASDRLAKLEAELVSLEGSASEGLPGARSPKHAKP